MKKLIEKFWADMYDAVMSADPNKIIQNFAPNAVYKFRPKEGMTDNIAITDMAKSCLEYKDILDAKYAIERIDELKDGTWLSIITCSVEGKPYFTTSFFKFKGDKITQLIEYYGDF